MPKKWIIPAVILLLLLLCYPFRWNYGPTITDGTLKVVNIYDRWTGQHWFQLYGIIDDKAYGGEMKPHFTDAQIASKVKVISLSSSGSNNNKGIGLLTASQIDEIMKTGTTASQIDEVMKKWPDWAYNWGYASKPSSNTSQAETKAINELTSIAYHNQNIATWIWAASVVISAIASILFFLWERKRAIEKTVTG